MRLLSVITGINKQRLVLSILLLTAAPSFAQLYMNSDPEIISVQEEYLRAGRLPPFYTFPVLPRMLPQKAIDPVFLSSGLRLTASLAFSAQYFSNDVLLEEGTANNGLDYQRTYLKTLPYASGSVGFWNSGGLGGRLQLNVRRDFTGDYFTSLNLYPGMGHDSVFLNGASLYYDSRYVSILFGREKLHIGPVFGTSLYPSDRLPWLDALRITVPFGNMVSYYWHMATIPNVRSEYQQDISTGNAVYNPEKPLKEQNPDYFYGFDGDDFPSVILNMFQRLSFQTDFFRAAVALDCFIARKNNRFELIDFIPFADWHSADVRPNNMSLLLDFSFVPVKNLLIGGQAGFDEINGNSIGVGDNSVPTIWAATGNILYMIYPEPVPELSIRLTADLGYTSRLWGNFTGAGTGFKTENGTGFARALYRYHSHNPMTFPMTSPYGSGAFWNRETATVIWKIPSAGFTLDAGIDWLILIKEEGVNLITTDYSAAENEKSIPSFIYNTVSVPIRLTGSWLTAELTPSLHIRNSEVWGEVYFGVKFTLDGIVALGRRD